MMKYFILLLFLIPVLNFWWIFIFSLFILSFFLFFCPLNVFVGNLCFGFGMDVVSYCMNFLTIWIVVLMLMASFQISFNNSSINEFIYVLYFMLFMLLFTFSTTNLLLMYIFFESSMVPILFLIFGWGYQPERLLAGFYLLFYTLFASLPMLLGILYIFYDGFTLFFFLIECDCNFYLYLSLILAFLVKMPLSFLHFWLPSAHVEAPVSGSMILAGVLLKLGGYGMYRVFSFIWFYSLSFNYFWIIFSLLGGVFLSILCLCQVDMKSLIAYSSVVHMSLVISGVMTFNYFGFYGSLVLMLGHGLCSSGLFALANIIYERSFSRSLLMNKGFITVLPLLSMFWFIFAVNNIASPLSLNFLGECLLLSSLVGWSSFNMIFLGLLSFFGCCYSIYLYSITQHGSVYSGVGILSSGKVREYLLMFYHFIPLNMLFLKVDVFSLWL
uniref:NADH-ubiquinone oxidoreductase chain 4 n=1 Tax=Antilochus coquebertii TaxID=1577200 RepID=A0A4Y1JW66_9HEMI|nr:NADH dehydrogenase subunit 4 [Antilochus coquebertii]APO08970.1 NADH dehydrogenase subunit 4 [Antilochus coquebertii]